MDGPIPLMMSATAQTVQLLRACPESQLDASMKQIVDTWPDEPTSIQILEVLDKCIFSSLASGSVVAILQMIYKEKLQEEGKKHEDNVPLATWRDDP